MIIFACNILKNSRLKIGHYNLMSKKIFVMQN